MQEGSTHPTQILSKSIEEERLVRLSTIIIVKKTTTCENVSNLIKTEKASIGPCNLRLDD